MPKPWHISSWLYASGCSTSSTRASISSKEAFSSVWTWANFSNLLESRPRARARNWVNTGVTQLKPPNRAETKWLVFLYLCSNSAFHHADVVVRRCSFVHLHTAVGDHKHSPIRELDVGGSQGMEFNQLCLADKHPKREKNVWKKLGQASFCTVLSSRRVAGQIDPWRVCWPVCQTYFSLFCQEGNGLVHAASLCANIALTLGTNLSQRYLEENRQKIAPKWLYQLYRMFIFKQHCSLKCF